jgi:hypothetical protein
MLQVRPVAPGTIRAGCRSAWSDRVTEGVDHGDRLLGHADMAKSQPLSYGLRRMAWIGISSLPLSDAAKVQRSLHSRRNQ